MKKLFILITFATIVGTVFSQSPGDTIVVQSFDYTMTTGSNGGLARSMTVPFPDNQNLTYEKIIMLYNMRCRDGNVNTTGGNYVACGEWDYSCNSYIHDSTRVDSTMNTTPSHSISGFAGSNYSYSATPVYNFYRSIQQNVTLNSVISETPSIVGAGSLQLTTPIANNKRNGKSQYLFTQAELLAAGAVAGDLDALSLNITNSGGQADFLRVRIKHSSKTMLDDSDPDLSGFNEVFFQNTSFINGPNRLQFYTPFTWDGTSNIIVEFSFTNPDNTTNIEIEGNNTGNIYGMHTSGDRYFNFNGSNYVESDNYKGIGGNTDRTIEAWINTTVNNNEITSWGADVAGQKWVFRLNNDGTLRAEVNGGYKYGTTTVDDGQWHHVAVVFSGTNITNALFYVDGNLENTGASLSSTVNTNATSGINMRVSRGVNNRYWNGIIDEVRVWSAALSATELQNWRYRSIDASHPNYSSLETYFQMNEGSGGNLGDATPYNRNASVVAGDLWTMPKGVALFKEMHSTMERPNVTFLQGSYNLTVVNDTVIDSIPQPKNTVSAYQIVSNSGTLMDDDIVTISSNDYWQATYHYYFDENGVKIDSTSVTPDGTIIVSNLNYQRRFPMKFEIISFVTPYGIGLDMGIDGKTWKIDLTDFTPVLKGDKLMTIERGGQWNEDLDIKFLFIVGTPPRNVLDIQQIWRNDYKGYTAIVNNSSFEPRDVMMNPNADSYKLKSAITGHGQEGEFIPRQHYLNLNGGANEFQWQVWKECAENPVYPQGGTWIYDRAGWCPGIPTDLQEYEIAQFVTPGQVHNFDYGVIGASGTSNYIVNNQLVSYDVVNHSLDASVVDIMSPSNYVEYERFNSICANPTIMIKNTGSTTLTSLTINYWINNGIVESYTWTGNLDFLEQEEVELPSPASLWASASTSNNTFNVEIKEPNSSTDEYVFNNKYQSSFEVTDILPYYFYMYFRTNNAASESKYELFDDSGTLLFSKTGMTNNTIYRDTFALPNGCYTFKISDTDDDGINFWANNDGNGQAYLREVGGGTLKLFEPDFGDGVLYNFSIDQPLAFEDLYDTQYIDLYPNPAQSSFSLEAGSIADADVKMYNNMGQLIQLPITKSIDRITFNSETLPAGIYVLKINYRGKLQAKKIIIE
ncbi:MAG: LamG-like jellyroll fold domain-containing protein [Crocinitomicaceae bacterium]